MIEITAIDPLTDVRYKYAVSPEENVDSEIERVIDHFPEVLLEKGADQQDYWARDKIKNNGY